MEGAVFNPPPGTEVYTTRTAQLWVGPNEIARMVCLPGLVHDAEDARENIRAIPEVKPRPIVVDIRKVKVDLIVDSFVARYGKKVLSAPTTKGFDLSAWIMPFVMLCLGLVVVAWVAVRMARPAATATDQAPPAVDPRVEEELKQFEKES